MFTGNRNYFEKLKSFIFSLIARQCSSGLCVLEGALSVIR